MAGPPLRLIRIGNPVVRRVLASPVHRLLSGGLVVLEYRGRRSGREFRIPLQYAETSGGTIVAIAVRPEQKLWWRAFARPTSATVLLAGAEFAVTGRVLEADERRAALQAYLRRFPRATRALDLGSEPTDAALDEAPAAVVAFVPA